MREEGKGVLNPGLNGSWGYSAKGQRGHSLKSTKFLLNVAAAFVSQIVTVSMESSLFNFFFFLKQGLSVLRVKSSSMTFPERRSQNCF